MDSCCGAKGVGSLVYYLYSPAQHDCLYEPVGVGAGFRRLMHCSGKEGVKVAQFSL
jgi:hypothetical protein